MKYSGARMEQRGGVHFWTVPPLANLGCRAAFFRKKGGVSQGPFRSLNLGLSTEDEVADVLTNRALAFKAAGFGPLLPVVGRQSHQVRLQNVTRRDAGRGWADLARAPRRTDGLFTRVPGLPLAVTVADCMPVLMATDQGRAVAAVHAGWRGLAAGILSKALDFFWRRWRLSPARVWVAIGPAIGPRAFLVRGEALRSLRKFCPAAVVKFSPTRTGYDLWRAAEMHLLQRGVLPEHLVVIRECTATHAGEYFSHRRDGAQTGRMLGMIQIDHRPGAARGAGATPAPRTGKEYGA